LRAGALIQLWRASRQRLKSLQHYRTFQGLQARLLIDYLRKQGVRFEGRSLLDLGSGIGGYSLEFAREGAKVVSLDLLQHPALYLDSIPQLRASAAAIPIGSGIFDIVFCASLIEHVPKPEQVLAEVERVLKPAGFCYISFPPYFSPRGGHEFAPFHYFGEKFALRMRRRAAPDWVRQLYPVPDQTSSFAESYQGWGLYIMTISKFCRLLRNTGLKCINMSTRYLPISLAHVPILREFFTWHIQFLLTKEYDENHPTPPRTSAI
jgi:SAM-dependent methyltransferase